MHRVTACGCGHPGTCRPFDAKVDAPYSIATANGAVATAALADAAPESRARGAGGCLVTVDASTGAGGDVRLVGPPVALEEGAVVALQVWGLRGRGLVERAWLRKRGLAGGASVGPGACCASAPSC